MIKAGIIGCGRIAGGYDSFEGDLVRTHAKAYVKSPLHELEWVYDSDLEKAKAFASTWGAKVAPSLDAFLKAPLDMVSIASSTPAHFAHLAAVLTQSSCSTIFCEKPLCEKFEQCEPLIAESYNSGKQIYVNYIRRFDPAHRQLLKDAKSGRWGALLCVQACMRGSWANTGVHMLNYLRVLLGGWNLKEAHRSFLRTGELCTFVVGKTFVQLSRLNNGEYGLFDLDLLFEQGRVEIRQGGRQFCFYGVSEDPDYAGYSILQKTEEKSDSMKDYLSQALCLIHNKADDLPTLFEAVKDLEDVSFLEFNHA